MDLLNSKARGFPGQQQLGPNRMQVCIHKPDTEIKRTEAHGLQIGLEYRKVNAIPKRHPPAFLLSTSLTLANRKMADARELQVPVVLCRDFMQARCSSSVRAWIYQA